MARSTVQRWTLDPEIPGGPKGPWDPTAVLAYFRARTSRNRRRGEPAAIPATAPDDEVDELEEELLGGARPTKPDARYRLAKAELAELKLQQEKGRLVERERVLKLLHSRAADLKRTLLDLPRALATRLVGKTERQIQAALRNSIEGALSDFVRQQGLHDLLGDADDPA